MIYKNQTMKSIKAYLTEPSPKEKAQTNEVIGVLLCTSLLAFCSKPLFETDGMKSLLGGIGSMFAGFGSLFSKNKGELKDDDLKTLKDLISKDPDDLSPKERKQLADFEKNHDLSEILSPNDMKKFNNAMGRGEKNGDEPSDKETKELKDLLKKKDEDLSPKEKKRLQELKGKYDWSEHLSDKDLGKLNGKESESAEEPKDKGDDKDKSGSKGKSKTTDTEKDGSSLLLASLALARESNSKEKDGALKKKNEAMMDLLTACSFDKDGNEIPLDQRMDKMKDMMSPEQFESFKKEMSETYEKVKDDQDFLDALTKAKENIKPEDYDKMVEDAKSKAKTTLDKVEKEKKAYDDYEKELSDLEEQAKKADEKKKKELEQQKKELEQNPPQSIMAAATGVSPKPTPSKKEEPKKEEPKKEEPKKEEPKKDDKKDNSDPLDKFLDSMGLSKEEKEVEKEYLKKSGEALSEKVKRDSQAFSEKFAKDQEISNEQFAKIGDANKEWFSKSQELKIGSEEYTKALQDHNNKINDINKEAADKRKKVNDEYTKKLDASDKQHKDAIKSLNDEKQANLDKIKNPSDDKAVKDAETEVSKKIDDIEAKYEKDFEKVTQDFDKKEKELNAEYEKKIKDAKSEDDVKKLKDELKKKQKENTDNWEKEGKKLSAQKHKEMDDVDDTDEHDTEKDETKQGKYKVKQEEIEDPKTGKKIQVKTYTGPRGGKFYYPDGKPKKPENKVYVESISLTDYLYESMY